MGQPRIVWLQETASTNVEAMALAMAGAELPCCVVAEQQTGGKGRSGRTWVSPPGNLYMSYVARVDCPLARAGELSLVAGVAAVETLRSLANEGHRAGHLALKWPNDIMAGHAKLGGILVETAQNISRGGLFAVIGLGINIVTYPELVGRAATDLRTLGLTVERDVLARDVADAFDAAVAAWDGGYGFAHIRERWLAAAMPHGAAIALHAGAERVTGRFAGLAEDGALLLLNEAGAVQRFTFGDVTLQSAGAT